MKVFVADLSQHENQVITSFFLVHSRETRSTKEGKPYLALRLGDQTGVVEGRVWEESPDISAFEADDFVKVQARVELYRDQLQLKIEKLRRARPEEITFADYFPRTKKDVEAMYAELRAMGAEVTNPHLRALLVSVLDDEAIARKLKQAPGAKRLHHAYLGGLLEHILSLAKLCQLVAAHYPALNYDLLLAGVVLHDLGKIEELSYPLAEGEARPFDYTTAGRLLGHILLELELVNRKMDALGDFPEELRLQVQHLIASHHGRLEFGSPVLPQTLEAVVLHYVDDLDSKIEAAQSSLAESESEWTAWNRSLERQLYRPRPAEARAEPPSAASPTPLFPDPKSAK
ncbi:MAG: HD domain-containing protein [Acidobacteria bacterium]|nr:HD domain-containing protein [Acidobacteriota bacterium]